MSHSECRNKFAIKMELIILTFHVHVLTKDYEYIMYLCLKMAGRAFLVELCNFLKHS